MKFKKKKIRGLSLAEVLIAMTISTLIFAAAYLMYSYFQSSFTRQLSLSDLQGEARVVMLNLDLDTKKAGYSLPNSLPVKKPVLILNNTISFCYDERTIRKRVIYSFDPTNKTITRSVYEDNNNSVYDQYNNCNPDDVTGTYITPTLATIANKVSSFSGTLQGNVIIINIGLLSENGVEENYNQRFFLKNYDRCSPVAITTGLIINFDACDDKNNNQTDRWVNKGIGGSNYDATVSGYKNYSSNGPSSYFSVFRYGYNAAGFFTFPPPVSQNMSWGIWYQSNDDTPNFLLDPNTQYSWFFNAPMIGHELGGIRNDWSISMGGGQICWGSGNLNGDNDQGLCSNGNQYNDGNWHYAVVTRQNGTENNLDSVINIYIDGNLDVVFTNANGGYRTTDQVIGIGTDGDRIRGWNANVAIVQGYNRVLSQDEVMKNYNAQKIRFGFQ